MVPDFLLLIAVFKGELRSGLYRFKLFIGKKSLMDSTGKTTKKY